MEEVWRNIPGSNGLYQVSNFGNIKSLRYRGGYQEKQLTPKKNNNGRLWVEVLINGKRKPMLIHRLVAMAFIPNPNGYEEINHIDENPQNNTVYNLEWCTHKHNVRCFCKNHPEHWSNRKQSDKYGKRLNLTIVQLTKEGNVVKTWNNSRTIKAETGMSDWSISECCRGKRHTAYGYIWRYAD